MRQALAALAVAFSLVQAACAVDQPPPPLAWEKGPLTIDTATGSHSFTVEIADDEAERERGLMYRTEMAADAGMIFLYPTPQPVYVWMKNTVLSLDMFFIQPDGTISHIARDAVPYSETVIPSNGKVVAFLELNAGAAKRLGIEVGDVVRFSAFGNAK